MSGGPTEIIKGIYVGNYFTSKDAAFFQDKRIGIVINCTKDLPFHFDTTNYRIPVNDSNSEEDNLVMAYAIPDVLRIVRDNSGYTNILIHCQAGVSRSCTVAAAILRACCCQSIPQAIALVVAKRPIAFFSGKYVNFRSALIQAFGS